MIVFGNYIMWLWFNYEWRWWRGKTRYIQGKWNQLAKRTDSNAITRSKKTWKWLKGNDKNADLLNELYQRGIINEEGELIN